MVSAAFLQLHLISWIPVALGTCSRAEDGWFWWEGRRVTSFIYNTSYTPMPAFTQCLLGGLQTFYVTFVAQSHKPVIVSLLHNLLSWSPSEETSFIPLQSGIWVEEWCSLKLQHFASAQHQKRLWNFITLLFILSHTSLTLRRNSSQSWCSGAL